MAITLTETAARKVRQHLERRGHGLGIRVGVRETGCSGWAYVLEFQDTAPVTRDYMTYDSHGVKIWVNSRDLAVLDGTQIAWHRRGLNEGFEFVNAREKARCGCGESFSV